MLKMTRFCVVSVILCLVIGAGTGMAKNLTLPARTLTNEITSVTIPAGTLVYVSIAGCPYCSKVEPILTRALQKLMLPKTALYVLVAGVPNDTNPDDVFRYEDQKVYIVERSDMIQLDIRQAPFIGKCTDGKIEQIQLGYNPDQSSTDLAMKIGDSMGWKLKGN